jgi:hypothetical protein
MFVAVAGAESPAIDERIRKGETRVHKREVVIFFAGMNFYYFFEE